MACGGSQARRKSPRAALILKIIVLFSSRLPRLLLLSASSTDNNNDTMNAFITSHTNAAGIEYVSAISESGETIYSFTEDFEDIWTQDDQDAIEAGSTPSKL